MQTQPNEPQGKPSMLDCLILVVKFIGWTVVTVVGVALVLLAVAYAGCMCSQHRM